jgi:transketolase
VGLAIGQAHFAARFNKPGYTLFDNKTFVFLGDGCMMEGITSEASSLAGHLGLSNLIAFYDDNKISIDGETDLAFTEDVAKRYEAYGWNVLIVANGDGEDLEDLERAIHLALTEKSRPTLIKVRTTIGFGSVSQGTEKVHGSPLGANDLANVKKKFGFDPEESFLIPEEVRQVYDHTAKGAEEEAAWNALLEKYAFEHPDPASELRRRLKGELPADWKDKLPRYKPEDAAKGTRNFSELVIQKLAEVLPEFVGGSADLNPSTLTYIKSSKDFQVGTPEGKNIRFGVREHAMAAIINGLCAYGGYIPYGSTFLNFLGYALGAFSLSALSQFKVLYIFTHDSIGLGEDGPTHQPIEKLLTVRSTPNAILLRPADGNETTGAYIAAIEAHNRPSLLALTRQAVPNLVGSSVEGVLKGAYILQDHFQEGATTPQVIITATGSEVSLSVEAAVLLHKNHGVNVRVVSFPSWELFARQDLTYQESVFLPGVPVLSVEAATVFGWEKWAHASMGMKNFGSSAPFKEVYKKNGLFPENIAEKAKLLIHFYKDSPTPSLLRKPF